MKSLEELDILPTPWRKAVNNFGMGENIIWDRDCKRVEYSGIDSCFSLENQTANLNMMVAAPKMYECLSDAVFHSCYGCRYENDGKCTYEDRDCPVQKWRTALAEASGEVSND